MDRDFFKSTQYIEQRTNEGVVSATITVKFLYGAAALRNDSTVFDLPMVNMISLQQPYWPFQNEANCAELLTRNECDLSHFLKCCHKRSPTRQGRLEWPP